MIKQFSGFINCIDEQLLNYHVSYNINVKYNVIKYFYIRKHYNEIINIIEYTIRTVVANDNLKVFIKQDLTPTQKEFMKFVDILETKKIQQNVQNEISSMLLDKFKNMNMKLIKCKIIFFDTCNSLSAALQ